MAIGPIEDDPKLYASNQYLLRMIEILNTLGGGGGGGGGLSTEAKQDDIITELQALAVKAQSTLDELIAQRDNVLTPSFSRTAVAGTVAAGKISVTFVVIGATDFIIDGTIVPNEIGIINLSTNNDKNTLGAITYDPNGSELLIITQEL